MKKKPFKILMLLVVAVSIGAFVSCKDTNEDLYNELRHEAAQNLSSEASLRQALEAKIAEAEKTIQALSATVDNLKTQTCTCPDPSDPNSLASLWTFVNTLNTTVNGDGSSSTGLIDQITNITNQITNLNNEINGGGSGTSITDQISDINTTINNIDNIINNIGGSGSAIETFVNTAVSNADSILHLSIDSLKAQLAEIKKCDCDTITSLAVWNAISVLEQRITEAKTNALTALDIATGAKDSAHVALTAAYAAEQIANSATDVANNAIQIAMKADTTSAEAKALAEDAKAFADSALVFAIKANDLAVALDTRVGANEKSIDTLKTNISNIQGWIVEYGPKIGANTDSIKALATRVADNAANIQNNYNLIQTNITNIQNLNDSITTLRGDVKEAYEKAVKAEADALANKGLIDKLREDVDANKGAIDTLKLSTKTLQDAVSNLATQVGNNTAAIDTLKNSVKVLDNSVKVLNDSVASYSTQLIDIQTRLTVVEAFCKTVLQDAKDYADAQIKQAQDAILKHFADSLSNYYITDSLYTKSMIDKIIAEQNLVISGHTDSIDKINEQIEEIKKHLCNCEPVDLTEILNRLAAAEGGITRDSTLIEQIKADIADRINKNITDLTSDLGYLTTRHDSLLEAFNNLKFVTPEDLSGAVNAIVAKAYADSLLFAQADKDLKDSLKVISDSITSALKDIIELKTITKTLENTTVKINDYTVDKDSLWKAVNANKSTIGDLQKAVNNINDSITALRGDITALESRVSLAESQLTQALNDIQQLNKDVTAIQAFINSLAQQVTSIEIQGTNNPMFGAYSDPLGRQSNVLLAYYGLPKKDVKFPTKSTSNYVRANEALTDKDWEMLGGQDIMEEFDANWPLMYEDGYAGKIYMTINPNTVDVSGIQPEIVNSLDQTSPITLTPIKPSEERLQFGITPPATRAGQSNSGFYEAEAVVTELDVQKINAPSFNTAAMKDAASNLRSALAELAKNQSTSGTGSKLERVASDIYQIVNGLRFDRSGLRVKYTTDELDGTKKEHSVRSSLNLAATAFQPLSLETAKDLNYEKIPGYDRVNGLLDRISNTLQGQVRTFFKNFNNNGLVTTLANFKINSIEIPQLDSALIARFEVNMDTAVIIGGLEYKFSMPVEVPVSFAKDLLIPVNINGIVVNVPVHIEDTIAVDLDNVSISTPTIVVHGSATGHPEEVYASDSTLVTELVLPVFDEHDNIVPGQYITIPISNLVMSVELDAGNDAAHGGTGAGTLIKLDGKPVAYVAIDDTITTTVNINQNIPYHFEIVDTFKVDISKHIQLGWVGYEKVWNAERGREEYALDKDGNMVPLKDADGNPIPGDKRGFVFHFNYDMKDAAVQLFGKAADAIGSINDGLLKDVQDLLDQVNDFLAQINDYEDKINGTIDNYIGKVSNYLDKINNLACNLINSTNDRFQPFMVASNEKGFKRLSGSKSYPTVLTSEVTLYPTSQTMELFVPFARKHVAVTNVYSRSDLKKNVQAGTLDKSLLTSVNTGNMNKVLDGTVKAVTLKGLNPKYVYEIAYSALDFHGKMATRKYYITAQ